MNPKDKELEKIAELMHCRIFEDVNKVKWFEPDCTPYSEKELINAFNEIRKFKENEEKKE